MAGRKRSGKKKKNVRKPDIRPGTNFGRAVVTLLLLIVLVCAGGYLLYLLHRANAPQTGAPPATSEQPVAPPHKKPHRGEKPPQPAEQPSSRPGEQPQPKPPAEPSAPPGQPETPEASLPSEPEKAPARPRVAIIIDDLGNDLSMAQAFLNLPAPLTLSILPHTPFARQVEEKAREKGTEVLVHLPMEPERYPGINPGPGTLLSTMSPDELLETLEKDLDAVPSAKGVNNHEGSKMTAEAELLYPVFTVLKKRGLFFIDSRTTSRSVCRPSARLLRLPFGSRDVFLDHEKDPEFITGQLRELIRIAQKKGFAIAIGHPGALTLETLGQALPELKKQVEIVPVSRLARIPG